jgi:protease-4
LIFGFLLAAFFLFMVMIISSASGDLSSLGSGLGVVEVKGPIADSREFVDQMQAFEENPNIKGIIVRVDSPGGAVAPSQEMFRAVQRARGHKKVVISMGNVAASGGYYIACAGDRVFANPGTVTGSIGVITQLTNLNQLADLARVDVVTIKSGRFKDMGNPFREFGQEDRDVFQSMVLNIYEQFIRDVAAGRKMDLEKVRQIADGRVYTGEQARDLGLVDELGGLHEAAAWLGKEAGIEGRPALIYPPKKQEDVLGQLLQGTASGVTHGVAEALRQQGAPRLEYRYNGPR